MNLHLQPETHGQSVRRRFEGYGFWIGLGLGALIGFLISGPNFHDWTVGKTIGVIVAFTIGGAVAGYFAGPSAIASETRGQGLGVGMGGVEGGGASEGGGSD